MNNQPQTNGHDEEYFEMENHLQNLPRPKVAPVAQPIDYSHMISIISAWKDILNARLLAVMALVGALAIFGLAAYDPTNLRLTAGSLYSMGVLWPIMWLFFRRG